MVFFKNWFSDYTTSFHYPGIDDNKNISLKINHTRHVCENAKKIAESLQLTGNSIMLAETAALFHDIGRFAQYAQYKTFKDSISENHGKLGVKILEQEGILQNLPENEQGLITNTVKFHSAFAIPDLKETEKIFFLKLIRDADKLDIWRVFVEYYNTGETERTSTVGQELPDVPGYTEEVLSCILEKKMASLAMLKKLNDFKLTQLSWVYDLNFDISFSLLLERNYIKEIISKLPQTEEIRKASDILHEFVYQKVESSKINR